MTVTEAHAHDHPDFLAHHFETPQQQFDAGKLGMWMFLATEDKVGGRLIPPIGKKTYHEQDDDIDANSNQFRL